MMKRMSQQWFWRMVLPLVVLTLFAAALPSIVSAQPRPPAGIESVTPAHATQGDANVLVTITLAQSTAPSSYVRPAGVRIGTLHGEVVLRDGLAITASFDVPADAPAGTKDVAIEFPGPRGTVTFSQADAFEIQSEVPAEDPPATLDPPAASSTDTESYPIVDTGQDTCYDNTSQITCAQPGEAFYGQDAQYAGNQPSYTLSADGLTVYDNVTGLTWTQSPDLDSDGDIDVNDKLTFAEAQTYADTTLNAQNYGGYSDWRLPTMKELYSLMDFRGTDPSGPNPTNLTPFIETDYFDFGYGDTDSGERIIDAQFWSSNTYVGTVFGNQTATFGLNLADGRIKGYPSGDSGPITKLNYAFFVRGNTDYGVNDFIDNGDGTMTDNATGLMWSQDDGGVGMNWEEALAWVQQKNDENYLGYNDWRLPNAKEMQSIVDYSRAPDATNSAAIAPIFNVTQITNEAGEVDYPWFWTSTTHARFDGSGTAGVYVCFGRATGYMNGSWMDVHGAGAQRSDPKAGNPADYPYGRGPQGDAIRIYNYVHLVRDADVLGDVDHDGDVDVNDVMLVAGQWGCQSEDSCYDIDCDLNKDGCVDVVDVMLASSHWSSD